MPKTELKTTEPESTTPKALAPANGYAKDEVTLKWHNYPAEKPDGQESCLCVGESYDSGYQDGYLLAWLLRHSEGEVWVIGKQQEEAARVTKWAYLPHT